MHNLRLLSTRIALLRGTFCDSSVLLHWPFNNSYQPHMTTDLWNTVTVTKKLNFKFYLILTTVNLNSNQFSQFSRSIMSTLWDPKDCSTLGLPVHHQHQEFTQTQCPLSQCHHPTISSSVIPFSSCLQSFPESGSFPMSQFFASGGQSIRVSASASVLPMNIRDWISFRTDWFDGLSGGY